MPDLFRSFPVLLASLFLTACIISPKDLFAGADAETPITAGRYTELVRQEDGSYMREDTVTLALDGNVYTLNGDDGRDSVAFRLFDIGEGLRAISTETDEGFGYAMLKITETEILAWAAVCQVAAEKLNLLSVYSDIDDDGLSCTVSSRDTLEAFLRDYAAAAKPDSRYTKLD